MYYVLRTSMCYDRPSRSHRLPIQVTVHDTLEEDRRLARRPLSTRPITNDADSCSISLTLSALQSSNCDIHSPHSTIRHIADTSHVRAKCSRV